MQQFSEARAEQRCGKSRTATPALFSNFLMPRKNGEKKFMEEAQPVDVVDFFAGLIVVASAVAQQCITGTARQ